MADLYIAWSYYFDAKNDFQQAEAVFRKGLDAKAQPFEELTQAHTAFSLSMSRRLLYNDESSQEKFRTTMEEKRSALTSLRAYKKKYVGSSRTGIAVRHENPGTVNQENLEPALNTKVEVHEDVAAGPVLPLPSETSVIRSIIDSARKKENVHEPGPWSKGSSRRKGGLFGKEGAKEVLDFNIMEDENLPPIPCPEKLYEKGIQLPEGFVSRNKPQTVWNIPMVVSEPTVPRSIPYYEKFLLYPNETTEISPEEYRGFKWFKDRSMTSSLTEQYNKIWENTFESGIRIPPGFTNCNVKQVEKEEFEKFVPDHQTGIVVPLKKIYESNDSENSLEELLAEKFKRGDIVLVQEDYFEEIDDMELTQIGDRRQSVYPASRASFLPRKSIVVRKSMLPPPTLDEDGDEEEEEKKADVPPVAVASATGAIRKSIMKRKLDDNDYKPSADDYNALPKKDFVSDTPPRSAFSSALFKPPAPVDKKQVGFSMEEDEATCSTQQFNFFLRAQSVSTPVAKKKASAIVQVAEKSPEAIEEASPTHDFEPPVIPTTPCADHLPKQLSTIMETTESTQSTKSSVENDTHLNSKTPKGSTRGGPYDPFTMTLRMPEEQTETCNNFVLPKIHQILKQSENRPCDLPSTPQLKFQPNYSLVAPPPQFDATIKSPSSESSTKTIEPDVTQIDLQAQTVNVLSDSIVEVRANSSLKITEARKSVTNESILVIPASNDMTAIDAPSPLKEIKETELEKSKGDTSLGNVPAIESDTSSFEIPATQETNEITAKNAETSIVDIPETQANERSLIEVPATQDNLQNEVADMNSLEEIPETQVNEPSPQTEETEVAKNDSIAFNIYEDSVMEQKQERPPAFLIHEDDTDICILHASRKENVAIAPASNIPRTLSDEFLDLLVSPKKKSIASNNCNGTSENVSDLLKFSNVSRLSGVDAELEKSLASLSMVAPSRKISSPFEFDADLNTQNFQSALGAFKNSTLLVVNEEKSSKVSPKPLDLSIAMEEDETCHAMPNVDSVKPVEFKVPTIPALKPIAVKPANNFEIFEDDDEMSRSIYKPQATAEEVEKQDWDEGCSFIASAVNQYEHTIVDDDQELSILVKEAIINSKGNPFNFPLRQAMLDHCNFSLWLSENVKTCEFLGKIPPLYSKVKLNIGDTQFEVVKFIAKGSYGSIYTGRNTKTGHIVAMKQEKPPSLWEYYICIELKDRLKDKRMLRAFMSIDYAIIANNSSVLMSEFSPYGTIITVCNKHKQATDRNIDEYVVMVLTTQLLSIIDHLHSCKIIHADVKPDNFLVMSK